MPERSCPSCGLAVAAHQTLCPSCRIPVPSEAGPVAATSDGSSISVSAPPPRTPLRDPGPAPSADQTDLPLRLGPADGAPHDGAPHDGADPTAVLHPGDEPTVAAQAEGEPAAPAAEGGPEGTAPETGCVASAAEGGPAAPAAERGHVASPPETGPALASGSSIEPTAVVEPDAEPTVAADTDHEATVVTGAALGSAFDARPTWDPESANLPGVVPPEAREPTVAAGSGEQAETADDPWSRAAEEAGWSAPDQGQAQHGPAPAEAAGPDGWAPAPGWGVPAEPRPANPPGSAGEAPWSGAAPTGWAPQEDRPSPPVVPSKAGTLGMSGAATLDESGNLPGGLLGILGGALVAVGVVLPWMDVAGQTVSGWAASDDAKVLVVLAGLAIVAGALAVGGARSLILRALLVVLGVAAAGVAAYDVVSVVGLDELDPTPAAGLYVGVLGGLVLVAAGALTRHRRFR